MSEDSGWKLVHGDVFRKPRYAKLLAVSVGAGVQILGMAITTLILACVGVLRPEYQGFLIQSMLLLFVLLSSACGFVSARLHRFFAGPGWKKIALLASLMFPGVAFCTFFFVNMFVAYAGSSQAVPFSSMFSVLGMWFGVSVPLSYLGALLGHLSTGYEAPVRTNAIPRKIPKQARCTGIIATCAVGGLLPFGAVYTELFFLLSSMWQHKFYQLFGFLLLVSSIFIVTCALVSIAVTYLQLISEDHRWWWRSFLTCGSSGVYVFLYALLYKSTRLDEMDDFIPQLCYICYMALLGYAFFLAGGAIGLLASFWFVRTIYSSIKVD